MPIGVVSDKEFEDELSRGRISIPVVIPTPTPGRKEGDVNVPESLQKIIGEAGAVGDRQEALGIAKSFGISPSSVSAYTNGATSTASYNEPKPDIISHINKRKRRIVNTASLKLRDALEQITDEKLQSAGLKVVAGVARDMAAIVRDMEPSQDKGSIHTGPTFVVYSPQVKKETHFETLTVEE